MSDCTTFMNNNKETKPENPKNYCFGCLCDNNERRIQNYSFICSSLSKLLKTKSIFLCYVCKRIAQHAELFIQNVQSNQISLENFSQATMDEKIKSQIEPLVNLKKQILHNVIELTEDNSNSIEESYTMVTREFNVKIEVKEETELDDDIETEFVNQDDDRIRTRLHDHHKLTQLNITEFPDMSIKEQDEFPLNNLMKEKQEIRNIDKIDLLNVSSKIKNNDDKKEVKKKERSKIKLLSITRQQCIEERTRMSEDQKYLSSMYKCSGCIKGFTFKGSYDTHMEKHSQSNGDFECDICKQRMESDDKLVGHMRYHFTRYKCPTCSLTRSCRKVIEDHFSACHLAGDHHYKCSQCDKKFKWQSSLRRHVSYAHARRERVQCAYCARTYADKSVLKSHMMLQHSKEVSAVKVSKKCVCAECGMAFRTPSQLRYHSIKHSDTRNYYCVECDKSFKSQSVLKNHLTTTAIHVKYNELPLSCSHCEKRFSSRRDVERHMNRMHLNVKSHKCDKCDKAYVNSWELKNHQRYTHEGYKRPLKFPCPMCDKVFNRNQILKTHIRTHTGERPYICSKCPAQFSHANILRTHDQFVHLKLTRGGTPKTGGAK